MLFKFVLSAEIVNLNMNKRDYFPFHRNKSIIKPISNQQSDSRTYVLFGILLINRIVLT